MVDGLLAALQEVGYFARTGVWLRKPCFWRSGFNGPAAGGEPGVGKDPLAQALSQVLARQLIRQCSAMTAWSSVKRCGEWDAAQLLHLRAAELRGAAELEAVEQEVYQPRIGTPPFAAGPAGLRQRGAAD